MLSYLAPVIFDGMQVLGKCFGMLSGKSFLMYGTGLNEGHQLSTFFSHWLADEDRPRYIIQYCWVFKEAEFIIDSLK